jgi:hypothetical protein
MAVAATPPAEPQAVGPVTASVTGGNGKVPTGAA